MSLFVLKVKMFHVTIGLSSIQLAKRCKLERGGDG
jgi:hypothetical protein